MTATENFGITFFKKLYHEIRSEYPCVLNVFDVKFSGNHYGVGSLENRNVLIDYECNFLLRKFISGNIVSQTFSFLDVLNRFLHNSCIIFFVLLGMQVEGNKVFWRRKIGFFNKGGYPTNQKRSTCIRNGGFAIWSKNFGLNS